MTDRSIKSHASQHRALPLLVLLVTSIVTVSSTAPAQTYRLTDLGTLSAPNAFAMGVNNAGQVVGFTETASGATRPFLWSSGTMTDIGTLGGASAQAVAINSSGQVAGVSYLADQTTQHATLWSSGTPTDLGTLGGITSSAQGMNDTGQVVGTSFNASGVARAFLWSGGVISDLGSLNGPGSQSGAYAINDGGIVVGSSTPVDGGPDHATSWQGGTITDLYPSAGVQSTGEAINGVGKIIGGVGVGSSAVLWNAGTSTILGSGSALGINTFGQIVGTSAFNTYVAALFTGGKVVDINTLLDSTSPDAAYTTLTKAVGINDSGWIIANAEGGYCVSICVTHAFLLTPEVLSLTVTPTTLSYGDEPVGTTSGTKQITVTNTAATPFGFNAFAFPADYSQTNNCGSSLAAGATCTIQVSFTPSLLGTRTATLAIASGGTSYPVGLTGFGKITAGIASGAPQPRVLVTSPLTVMAGTPVTLTWDSTTGSTCTASGGNPGDGWTGSLTASGTQVVTESTTGQVDYVVTCVGDGQTAQAQSKVTFEVYGTDSYDSQSKLLTIPLVIIGSECYSNMVVTVGSIVTAPSGSSPNGSADIYNPAKNYLAVESVRVGPTTYYNAEVTVNKLVSIGGVTGADRYDGNTLNIPSVQVGNARFRNVVITVKSVVSVAGGMPTLTQDEYISKNNQLLIPVVQFGGKIYTNVVITVGKIVSEG